MKQRWIAKLKILGLTGILMGIASCGDDPNNPYPNEKGKSNALYTAFTERPKHLDPAISYEVTEAIFTYQIYEPPLQYAYLTRPYTLVPLTATQMPTVRFETSGNEVYSIYTITIKPGIYYQPHPAFATDPETGAFLYHALPNNAEYRTISDFEKTGTRELVADDYVFEIKRLADPRVNSPIYGVMADYIVGLRELSQQLRQTPEPIDLKNATLSGVKTLSRYEYEIKIKGRYPQFMYWLSMPFFAPMPWEAIAFYDQPVLKKNNVILDWYPVGTGPYVLAENNPNLRMVLAKNPNFHGETYPTTGDKADEAAGLLAQAGKPLPLIDKIIFTREKESIPYWTKFLQGYFDQSGVTSDNFDQALKVDSSGQVELSDAVKSKGIRLSETVLPMSWFWGFNMLDDTVGGLSTKKAKLRQAISIAMNVEQYISIFLNGAGVALQGPIPPGIFGYVNDAQHYNPFVYKLNDYNQVVRRNIEDAKQLLKEAGYPNGIDPKTKKPFILYLDIAASSNPDAQAQLSWYRGQLKKIGIDLVIRATQGNRFQDKIENGDVQMFFWGWNADYPDPENFLFLWLGKNGRVKYSGENVSNYNNPEFDRLFEKMKMLPNSPERFAVIQDMVKMVQRDSPMIWGFTPTAFTLRQQWVNPFKPNAMSRSTYKYISIDPALRDKDRTIWNHPIRWPLILGCILLIILSLPAVYLYWQKTHQMLKLWEDKRKQKDV